jgi:hypothetical protein
MDSGPRVDLVVGPRDAREADESRGGTGQLECEVKSAFREERHISKLSHFSQARLQGTQLVPEAGIRPLIGI